MPQSQPSIIAIHSKESYLPWDIAFSIIDRVWDKMKKKKKPRLSPHFLRSRLDMWLAWINKMEQMYILLVYVFRDSEMSTALWNHVIAFQRTRDTVGNNRSSCVEPASAAGYVSGSLEPTPGVRYVSDVSLGPWGSHEPSGDLSTWMFVTPRWRHEST